MGNVQAAEVVLPCAELHATLSFFSERLGFRVEAIFPADDPAVAVISGHGVRLRLERGQGGAPGILRLVCREPSALAGGAPVLVAPNGTRIELVGAPEASAPPALPPPCPSLVSSRMQNRAGWVEGRAGMHYRDLVPGRLGGGLVASHIRIPVGGPVPDYVHYHEVQFQLIYCRAGWARVVYEDQGEPFVLAAGDGVLQPPRIRHRVLESSSGLEVIEIAAPAEHETRADHELALPTPDLRPGRTFSGQRFVRHELASARWRPWRLEGFVARDLAIGPATGGIAEVHVARVAGTLPRAARLGDSGCVFAFVLQGSTALELDDRADAFEEGDAFVLPAGALHALSRCSRDLELLTVTFPGRPARPCEPSRRQ